MDESTLRNYFRKAIGVAPGASRKELKLCRDKRAQRWRSMLAAPGSEQTAEGQEAAKLAEQRLAITNTAYDCLSNADKFREFQAKLAAGEAELPDLDSLLSSLDSEHKPVAPRVLAKRQAQLQEKMERIVTLVTESVQKAGHDEALKLTQGKLPDADQFYDAVYKAAVTAGNKTSAEEIASLNNGKIELDETFKSDLDSLVIDQSEIIAHKEYDRLEDRAAMSAPTPAMPRFVALTLTLIIMGLVVSVCFYGATSSPTPNVAPAVPTPAAQNPADVSGRATEMAPAPVPGIANSVFNRSTFGPPSSPTAITPPVVPVPVQPAVTPVPADGAAPVATSPVNTAPGPAPAVSAAEANQAELTGAAAPAGPAPDARVAVAAGLVANAGNAGMAGLPASDTKPGAKAYRTALDAGMKGAFADSVNGFRQAYAEGHLGEALYNEGVILGVQGRYDEALAAYNKLLSDHPAFAQALYNRALTHQLLALAAWNAKKVPQWRSNLNQALASYDLALKADPRLSQGYFNRGIVHYQLGQKDEAYSDFARADSLLPKFMPAAAYNRDVVGLALKKGNAAPAQPAPACPLGPVGPAGPP
ncbi:MAG: tetratricopeptide repeat protein [Cyanobacteria bacterium SZAS LIN-3]|nr:tetratricopeptide repeat protein [Cyanobacteria bacterium SZAS LIN-3]